MKTVINSIRAVAFNIVMYVFGVPIILAALVSVAISQDAIFRMVKIWTQYHYFCVRVFLGITVRFEGERPEGVVLYAMKHESMFEAIDLLRIFRRPVAVAKSELAYIPVWGIVARKYGMIFIDRQGGAKALREMMRTVRGYIADGRPIVIFPEGTRAAYGSQPKLQSGFAGLYKIAGLPVVPVAVNSGRLITKGRFAKRPGEILYQFGEQIPAGLPREEIETRVHKAINALNESA